MKLDLIYPAAIAAVALLYAANSHAGGYGSGEAGGNYIRNDVHPVAVSGAVANSRAISNASAVGVGGAGGLGGAGGAGGAVSGVSANASGANQSMSDSSKSNAYALGLSLTTSQGECPFLGSANIGPIGFTYEVQLCGVFQRMKLVSSAPGVSAGEKDQAYMNLICQDQGIRAALPSCINR